MAIVDQWGSNVTSRRFAHAASRNSHRGPRWHTGDRGIDHLIPQTDRKTIAALSRRLVFNHGPAKEAIRQKASYSVGCAWMPIYTGSDTEAGEDASSWLENVWFPLCDFRGAGHDWHEFLEIVSKCMDRDGESFVLLTENKDGFPQLQHVPSYQVWNLHSTKKVEKGPYSGLAIEDGVILNKRKQPVAYRVNNTPDGKDFEDISARDLIHVYDSDFPEQRRGLPAFAHALNDLKNSMSSTELETIRQNIISSIYLVEKSQHGPDPDDPAWTGSIDTTNEEAVLCETIQPGVRHISGPEEIDVMKHENPGDIWESFQDRIIRSAVVGMGWAYSLIWKSPGQGTAERAEVVRARKAVEARQKRLRYVAKRAVTFAVAKGDASESLTVSAPGNMLKWSFNLPERLTVDDGREARALQEGVLNGTISEPEFQAFKGKGFEQHCKEQAAAIVIKQRVADEVTASTGVQILPGDLGARSAGSAPEGEASEGSQAVSMKEQADAYGVAVRAGAITPQVSDEQYFRSEAGLPDIEKEAKNLWGNQGGTRQPITLVQEGAEAQPIEEPTT